MTRSKKPLDDAFHRAVTNTLGPRSPYVVAREADLPTNAISRVLEGTDPQLSRAIEVAKALGFEIRYEWPRGKVMDQGGGIRSRAAMLAVRMMTVLRPGLRDLTEHPLAGVFAEALIHAYEDIAHELGPTRTSNPDEAYGQMLRMLERQMAARAAEADSE